MFDIVQCDDGRRHSIMKGDKVLAPTEIGSELYAPGTVIDGQEGRETSKGWIYVYIPDISSLICVCSELFSMQQPEFRIIWIFVNMSLVNREKTLQTLYIYSYILYILFYLCRY